jgi:hypothetical protein
VPLPEQALDHGGGFLLAAAVADALAARAASIHASLLGVANVVAIPV